MTDTHGAVHTLRYVRMLVTAESVGEGAFERAVPPAPFGPPRDLLRRANAAFMSLDPARREVVGEAAATWVADELRAKPGELGCLGVVSRASWLLANVRCTDDAVAGDVRECGPVIAECHMDVDKITEWCPTAGLFAGNSAAIASAAAGREIFGDAKQCAHT
jgi:hypothetical protein